MPKSVTGEKDDGSFDTVSVPCSMQTDPAFEPAALTFSDYAQKLHGVVIMRGDGIQLDRDDSLTDGEYRAEITENGVRLFASGLDGASYAFATLLQLMKAADKALSLPKVTISDRPECPYRSVMVDLAREWHPFDTLFAYVDLCYMYKIKYLHLHFIDTQSYTLPSDRFPKLPTEGRHYTREEIAALNSYAYTRGVELIPEIEVPGHAAAMVNAYPELFANTSDDEDAVGGYTLVEDKHKNNIICVGKEGVMDRLREITEEIIEMFPRSRYLHIGGDEAKISDWATCPDCKRYMKEREIDGVLPLYSHFVKEMTDLVLSLGRTPIVWEGFPKAGAEQISRDVLVIAWESYYHLAPDLLEEGFDLVNASWQPLYIVPSKRRRWDYKDILAWNIYNWQHWYPKSPAHLNPINVSPTDKVKGAILCVWECTYEEEVDRASENLAALSERTWTIRRYAEDEEFRTKLDAILPIVRKLTDPHKQKDASVGAGNKTFYR